MTTVRSIGLALSLLLALAASGAPLVAQTAADAVQLCESAGGAMGGCTLRAFTAEGVLAALSGAAVAGSPILGGATTLGQRVGGGPRMALFGFVRRTGASIPGLADSTFGPVDFAVTSWSAGAAVGLFEGVRIMPTVGGFFSVDAFVHAAWMSLPGEDFDTDPFSLTVGTRVGILREGFSVPGISLSVSRSFVGAVEVASGPLRVDPSVTALRATIGKDVGGFELLGGWGWDDRSADVTITESTAGVLSAALEDNRQQWFVGVAKTFSIVLTLGVEVGRIQGGDPAVSGNASYDRESGRWFGTVFARLTS
ncbi:MAG: hypothetical protein AAF389_12420 [Gemmatimonadota bacterium]